MRLTENLISHSIYNFLIGNDVVEVASSVKLLGVDIDDQLSFNLYISNICKSASKQLNALVRLKSLLGFAERKVSLNSFILSSFNYSPLVWSISSAKSLKKVEHLQKRALRFYIITTVVPTKNYFKNSGKSIVNVFNYRSLCIEIFKTLNDINPSFIKDIFKLRMMNRPTREIYKLNLEIPKLNQVKFGKRSLRYLGPKVWNSLLYHIKSSENLTIFKTLIKNCNGTVCSSTICKNWNYTLSASFLGL